MQPRSSDNLAIEHDSFSERRGRFRSWPDILQPANEDLFATQHERWEIIMTAVVYQEALPFPVPDDWRPGCTVTDVEQSPILLLHRLRAHRQPATEPAQVDIDPCRLHHLVWLDAHRTVFSNPNAHRGTRSGRTAWTISGKKIAAGTILQEEVWLHYVCRPVSRSARLSGRGLRMQSEERDDKTSSMEMCNLLELLRPLAFAGSSQ